MYRVTLFFAYGPAAYIPGRRKVQMSGNADLGSSDWSKMRINIVLEVETIDFDVHSSEIRLKGKNVEESEFLKMGKLTFFARHI